MSLVNTQPGYEPSDPIYLELWMIGVIVSAVVYGGILTLTLSYIPLLLKTSQSISRRMRNFLLLYVTFMVGLSTVYIITMIIALTYTIFYGFDYHHGRYFFQNGLVGAICTTLANWGADGFMLWRCAVLYDGISRRRRIALIAVLVFLGLMAFASGLLSMLFGFLYILVMICVTVALNVLTAILITLRILHFEKYTRKTMGVEHNSPYMTVLIICVESSALMVIFSLIYFILVFQQANASYIPMQLLVHVYVLSPLLIVYRVARGKAVTITEKPSEGRPVVSAICFKSQPLSSGSVENI
ncbi:hypothetical protein BYT27DRAFT_7336054 [Phlegmacium glaucopus]|nr:hypothetical protein BYT27DRAFT_7336054 [Phlegmacium glaucopus]